MRLVLLAALAVVLAGCTGGTDTPTPTTPASPTPTATPSATPTPTVPTPNASGADLSISISNFAYSPADANLTGGGKVSWTNDDQASHTVTADDGTFDSGTLAPGAAFSTNLTRRGDVRYHCAIHPGMTGVIHTGGNSTPTPTPTVTPTPTPSGETKAVTIQLVAFSPADVTVSPGTTVTWTNKDAIAHTSTADAGAWDSGSLGLNEAFSFTFTTPGTYAYHCKFHATMTGTVTVA